MASTTESPAAPPAPPVPSPGGARRPRVTMAGLITVAALVAVGTVICRRVGDPDFFWHLMTGQWMLDHGQLPAHELFTYTVPGHAWVDQEWGNELILALLYRGGGMLAESLFYTAVTWLGFWWIWRRIGIERVPAGIAAVALLIGAAAGVVAWGPRSQMISFTGTCLTLLWVEAFLRDRHRHLYWLPLVVVGWANLHGGFVYGLAVVGLAAVSETVLWLASHRDPGHRRRARGLWAVLGVSAVAALVNPHTGYVYAVSMYIELSHVQQAFIAEWQTPSFHNPEELGLELMLLLTLVAMALRRQRLWDVLTGMFAGYLALAAERNAAEAAALAVPLLAWAGAAAWEGSRFQDRLAAAVRRRPGDWTALTGLVCLAVVVATGGVMADTLSSQTASTNANFPVAAADCLAANPGVGTRMLNAYDWGGYLLYAFSTSPADTPAANRRVFVYGEATLMGNALVQEISDVENAMPDWQRILAENGVDYVIERPDSALTMALSVDPAWQVVYDDGFAVITVKRSTLAQTPWSYSAPACSAGRLAPGA